MINFLSFQLLMLATISHAIDFRDTIKIGLLVPDKLSVAAKHGAELAIMEANSSNRKNFVILVTSSMEGSWGTGAKKTVEMIFEKKGMSAIARLQ